MTWEVTLADLLGVVLTARGCDDLCCKETFELITQVQRLVARLMDWDWNIKETFDSQECQINHHHITINCEETQVCITNSRVAHQDSHHMCWDSQHKRNQSKMIYKDPLYVRPTWPSQVTTLVTGSRQSLCRSSTLILVSRREEKTLYLYEQV